VIILPTEILLHNDVLTHPKLKGQTLKNLNRSVMKKYLVALAAITLITACGGGESKPAPGAEKVVDNSSNPDYQKGLALIAKSDCLTCHKVSEKLVGPAYKDVAKKYTSADISMLADKVLKGGTGVWGQVPMTPHPNMAKEDAEQIIKYILLLK
jgi:cytochrome c